MPKRATSSRSRLGVFARIGVGLAALVLTGAVAMPSIAGADPGIVSGSNAVYASSGVAMAPATVSGPASPVFQPVNWCPPGQWCGPGPGPRPGPPGFRPGPPGLPPPPPGGFHPGPGYYGPWQGGPGDWRGPGIPPPWGAVRVHIHFWWNGLEYWDGWYDQGGCGCWQPWPDW